MAFSSNVAPKRIVAQARKGFWTCVNCSLSVKYYWTTCPSCSFPRPDIPDSHDSK